MKAIISEKGQVTIPQKLREQLGLKPGEVLEFEAKGGTLVGRIIASAVAWAELRPLFESTGQMAKVMGIMMVDFDPLDEMAANLAGEAWKVYRSKGGPKERIISDFLIGAHAQMRADRFLTRDRGFYRQYFNKLNVLEP
ncbi:MAG: AbrB/MazE/SpoVT family DNA-binding domain-containing protein [Deltaproteobacteria bacterium]|nr:AbrB/MazE/SpoVT family DNA-binding domain-containing protein [Deltaproteobacteria bacterium]